MRKKKRNKKFIVNLYLTIGYHLSLATGFCLIFSCCTFRTAAMKPGFDFSRTKTIGIGEFTSYGQSVNSGEIFKDEFARQLILMGYNVKRSISNVDIILSGTVTEYYPSKKYLVYSGEKTIAGIPTLELSGTNAYSLGTAFGFDSEGEIMVSNATAGVSARLVDPSNNEIVWTHSFTYEGLDIQTAVEGAVYYIVKSLIKKR